MIDNSKIEQAVRLMLEGIGEDPEREGLRETPARIARMCAELYKGMEEDAQTHLSRTFTVETGKVAELANAECICRYGDTVVHVAVTASAKLVPVTSSITSPSSP